MPDEQPSHSAAPQEYHGQTVPQPAHRVSYGKIAGLLIALTVLTVGVSFLNIRSALARALLILCIASVQGIFVMAFLMQLRFESKLIRVIMLVPLILSALLMIALIPDIIRGNVFNLGH